MIKIIASRYAVTIALLFSLSTAHNTRAQTDALPYNYSQTVAIILKTENGGHIFQRPDHENPRNLFIIILGIISTYTDQMKSEHAGLILDIQSLPVEERLLLINNLGEKLLYLGDHWIGDGQNFAIMESADYKRIKGLIEDTKKIRGAPPSDKRLKLYIGKIRDLWAHDEEEYYREYHFPEQSYSSLAALPESHQRLTSSTPKVPAGANRQSISSATSVSSAASTQPASSNAAMNSDVAVSSQAAMNSKSDINDQLLKRAALVDGSEQSPALQDNDLLPETNNINLSKVILSLCLFFIAVCFWWYRRRK
ncbi:hypothetical protein [Cellvibrio sp. NN19]|uniref:hypothetical protein n=1 Tax=Cellvibrio chitinivorans TaxID=3102792 RepID=UPI002B4070EE|nr:hypothetical protein [Cellvibrio sp. NN19]